MVLLASVRGERALSLQASSMVPHAAWANQSLQGSRGGAYFQASCYLVDPSGSRASVTPRAPELKRCVAPILPFFRQLGRISLVSTYFFNQHVYIL